MESNQSVENPASRVNSFRQAVRDTLWEEDTALSWVAVEDTPHGVLVKNASILHPDNRTSLEALLSRHWDVEGEVVYREGVLGVRDTLDEGVSHMEKGASLRLGGVLTLVDMLNRDHGAGIDRAQPYYNLLEETRKFASGEVGDFSVLLKSASSVNPGEHQAGLIPGVETPEPPKAKAVIIGGNPARGRERVEAYHQSLKDFLEELGYETQLVSSEAYTDIPHADLAIGYSRGGGRLQFSDAPVKIAVGSEVDGLPSVRHPDDTTFRYRLDELSTIPDGVWDAHFTLTDDMKERIRELISPGVEIPRPSYKEGGRFTHDGVAYDLDEALQQSRNIGTVPVEELEWVLEHDTVDPSRVTEADLEAPILIATDKLGRKTVVDGLHRLYKAVQEGITELPANEVILENTVAVKEAAVGDFSYGCLMLPVPYDLSRQLVAWSQKHILEKNLDAQGIEFQPHVTVCYGFQPGFDAEELRPLMKDYAYISAKLGKVSRFETETYDVLKLEVVSADLRAWNRIIRERFDITTSYPDYKPHLTLAYVRPGTCKHLDGNNDWTNAILTTDRLEWSPADGAKKNLYLRTKRIVTQ